MNFSPLIRRSLIWLPCAAFVGLPAVSFAQDKNANALRDIVSLFDEAVAAGLPRTLGVPVASAGVARKVNLGDLVIETSLEVDVVFPGEAPGTMYAATWQGSPAVVTRSGEHLDISIPGKDGVVVTGFVTGSAEPHTYIGGETEHSSERADPVAQATTGAKVASSMVPSPRYPDDELTFYLFPHDDTRNTDPHDIHAGFVAWWLADLRRVLIGEPVHLLYSGSVRGVTDISYGTRNVLIDWSDAVHAYAQVEGLPYEKHSWRHKYFLITKALPYHGVAGVSWQGGIEGIGSIRGPYPTFAHEFGHMLGATHADADTGFNGWICETNMLDVHSLLRSNCYTYSPANQRTIREIYRNGSSPIPKEHSLSLLRDMPVD
ncbi:hypothetical protein EC912_104188 [Luteibacter rhizovicinus]|uniref:Reprolysin-like metallo-peptidase family M12B n=2 Tax=Luteibacter rhizovicinus TaxID=242606 RepID=A0A4R3YNZ7_9GAMM|nr:hypothetical protein EC912_104188 [Luteibacter rhizovicinus]